jgi:hypothetical protein
MLTAERLRTIVNYDPDTGLFTWVSAAGRHGRYPAGSPAGFMHGGYVCICIDGFDYRAHRLAWLWMTGAWPSSNLDHRDLNRANNRWDNLREATRSENGANRRQMKNNKSGFKGVSWYAPLGKWRAAITLNKHLRHIGYFANPAEAHAAYCAEAKRLHGEFARTG